MTENATYRTEPEFYEAQALSEIKAAGTFRDRLKETHAADVAAVNALDALVSHALAAAQVYATLATVQRDNGHARDTLLADIDRARRQLGLAPIATRDVPLPSYGGGR